MPTLAETKDIVTMGAALLSPFIGAGTAIWVYRRKEREIIDGFIVWTERMTFSGPEDLPTLVIQNRSEKKVAIRRVIFSKKRRARLNGPGTSLYYEDPNDLSFPYEIDAGSTHSFTLDDNKAIRLAQESRLPSWLAGLLRRPRFWVVSETMAGTRLVIGGEEALPWKERAEWARQMP